MYQEQENLQQLYQVNVVIIEGRHLAIRNADTKVNISVGKKKKTIHAKNNGTDCPYYNDFCVFLFRKPLSVLQDELLTIRVYEKSITKRLIGSFSIDLRTVWSQPNHQFYHKWAVLTDPKSPTSKMRGFLKCDIAILTKGVVIKPSSDNGGENLLEDNLLVPYGGTPDRKRIRVVFSVFRADSFSYYTDMEKLKLHNPYVKITYGGTVGKTSIAKNRGPPVWNEELTFLDLFPPLTQNILIEIFDRRRSSRKSLANTNIEIGTLYEDGKHGFLPTFGPNFLYLYRPLKKFDRHRNFKTQQNSFTYMGRVLLALRTEIVDTENVFGRKKKHKVVPKPIPPLTEEVYFEYNKFILFAAIFDALFFDSKFPGKNINIQVMLGPKENLEESQNKNQSKKKKLKVESEKESHKHVTVVTDCNTTAKHVSTVKGDYSFIAFPGKFPCVHVFGEWPDSLRRMYCSNVIKRAIQNCTNEINQIKYDLQFETEKRSESSKKLKAMLAHLSKSCEVILLLTNVAKLEDTNLCKQRKRVYDREIADIAIKAKKASNQKALKTEVELRRISTYLARLTKYAQDPENSFPDTEIWLLKHNKEVAQYRIRTEDVAFSKDCNNRGIMSGKTQTILFRGKKGKLKAKVDIFVWFGLADDFVECLKMLPDGLNKTHIPCTSRTGLKIPRQLIYDEKHHFQCRAHIFQGKILYGYDKTGLADPFVRIIVLGQNKKSQTRKTTLSPIWDETLVIPLITLYGPSEYIKKNPLSITVEVFDRESSHGSELVGRGFVTPLIKLRDEKYEPPHFPPKLKWEGIRSEYREVGKVLMATELLELTDTLRDLYTFDSSENSPQLKIPENIRPHNVKYRLEILFWGIRQLKKKTFLKDKMFVTLECGENLIKSPILHNVRHKLNFSGPVQIVQLDLPKEPEYAPPFSLKLFQMGSITHKKAYVGTCLIPSVRYFLLHLMNSEETEEEKKVHFHLVQEDEKKRKKKKVEEKIKKIMRRIKIQDIYETILFSWVKYYRCWKCRFFNKCKGSAYVLAAFTEEEKNSWWTRYYASEESTGEFPGVPTFKIYREELEAQPQFREFQDSLHTFNIVTGHEKSKKGPVVMAQVKVAMALYKWPSKSNEVEENIEGSKFKSEKGILLNAYSNNSLLFVLRVYIVCGKNLAPKDVYGKSDPYLYVQLGDQRISDRESYQPKQLNPTFGKCYEFKGTFPRDSLLRIKVIDYDVHSHDDLIGETSIDVENRYYSKYHATCGLAKTFDTEGFNFWRDTYLPTEILRNLCERSNLKHPVYEKKKVVIEGHEFLTPDVGETREIEETQALMVLNRWHEMPIHGFHLVPEHVETRSLYHPSIPGIEQGKLQLWIDIFPADYRSVPPKVDITPQPPVAMELRAIIWNVVDVVLDDRALLVNGRVSDIYLKGWILSLEEERQKTDIHYKSLNGEGNFNWRFIFHFNYIPLERKIIVKKKIDAFDRNPEERKVHCKLEIQVWDNDAFGDDYLGTLILELCSMPRGAKLSNRCTLKMLAPNAAKINLFNIKRTRGWWPFRRLKMKGTVGNEFELTGKIDLELEVLTEAEAKQFPAGKGRNEPDPLPPPQRPDTSFNWFLNPFKTFRYIIWRRMVKLLVIASIIILIATFFLSALYALPNYTVKKWLGA